MQVPSPPALPPPPPPPFGAPAPPHRTLHRDRSNAVLGGVAAGIAETYGLDVALVRVVWLIAALLQIGVPAYIIAWIAIPPSGAPRTPSGPPRHAETWGTLVAVVIGITLGSLFLPRVWRLDHFGAPLLLIGGGIAILVLRRRDDGRDDGRDEVAPVAPYAAAPTGTTEFASGAPGAGEAAPSDPAQSDAAPTVEQPAGAPTATAPVPPTAWTQTAPWPAPADARAARRAVRIDRRARRPRPFVTPVTLSLLLIGAGIASLVQATGAADVNLTVVLAIATCVVGAALVVAAFVGRAHTLIAVGIVLLAATAVSNTLDVPLRGGIGNRSYRPEQLSDIQNHYEVGIGRLEIDLRNAPLSDRTTVVDAQTGVGELVVFVPSYVRVEVHAHAGAGSVMLFGRATGGWPENDDRAVAGSGTGLLKLDLRVGVGQVRVRRFEPGGIETILGGA
jgi:phage shock protein PspC (stress-responsive transcriptional regulator)/predicted membrane protein